MKLSEAIYAGLPALPLKACGWFFTAPDGRQATAACVLGTAWYGAQGDTRLWHKDQLFVLWPILAADNEALYNELVERNDQQKQTRKAIADILEARGL